jgi:Cu/Ag efflux protein CusF
MKTRDWMRAGGVAVVLALAGCATNGAKPMPATDVVETTRGDDSVKRTQTVTVQATVVAVDQQTRMVTLRGPEGEQITFRADDAVKNLPQVRKGDMVTAVYRRALAFRLEKPGEKGTGPRSEAVVATAESGQKPAAVGAEATQLTATITKVDRAKNEVTLRGPKGKSVTLAVEDPTVFDRVKKGDKVEVTYTEALAISVDKP